MNDITLTFYELQTNPRLADFWPLDILPGEQLADIISNAELDFEDDITEAIEDWAEDVFISQYIVQLDRQAFIQAEQDKCLLAGLQQGALLTVSPVDFVSQIDNADIAAMINQLLSLSLQGWDMDDDLAKEESEVADLIGFLAATKMRGHSLLGVAVNS